MVSLVLSLRIWHLRFIVHCLLASTHYRQLSIILCELIDYLFTICGIIPTTTMVSLVLSLRIWHLLFIVHCLLASIHYRLLSIILYELLDLLNYSSIYYLRCHSYYYYGITSTLTSHLASGIYRPLSFS